MAVLAERTRLYEILLRFDSASAPAAVQRRIHEVLRDGVVVAATELSAEPIDPATVGDLMSANVARLMSENLQMRAVLTEEQRRALKLQDPTIRL